ncbi:MAG TPA: GNAT family N-acetyltransferase [Vicinamibacteria bacterium]|jgi:chorismate synthase|nr:GNAT family N-acetyltransferase [Vicinamibacteria bacterium]
MTEDLRIRAARERADYDLCVLLQRSVWALEDVEITSAIQMIASCHAGGLVQIAEAGAGQAVGFVYAFPALRGGGSYWHSDMLAVLPDHQKRGVGARLKWAQREEALRRGISLITWTYDPLQARNANLNHRRLGATAVEYLTNFYGITTSALHHGLPTDRLFVRWDLNGEGVRERAGSAEPPPTVPTPNLPRINDVKWQAGWPVSSEPRLDLEAPELLLEIPPDWDVLCQAAPRVAEGWQGRVARAFQAYLGRGYVVDDFAPTEEGGRRRPLYQLRKG